MPKKFCYIDIQAQSYKTFFDIIGVTSIKITRKYITCGINYAKKVL